MIPSTVPVAHSAAGNAARNACIAALPAEAQALLRPHLKTEIVAAGAVLWEPGRPLRQAYFPISALLSLCVPMQDGGAIEVGSVGAEGAAGGFDADGGERATRGVVLIGGVVALIDSDVLLAAAEENREIGCLVHFCRDWLLSQAQQLAACNAVHSADKRLCRWLVSCQNRAGNDRIDATQELIGSLLGIRRTTVTLLAQSLHAQGLIDYARGKIVVREPARLKASACECCDHLGPARWPSTRLAAGEPVSA